MSLCVCILYVQQRQQVVTFEAFNKHVLVGWSLSSTQLQREHTPPWHFGFCPPWKLIRTVRENHTGVFWVICRQNVSHCSRLRSNLAVVVKLRVAATVIKTVRFCFFTTKNGVEGKRSCQSRCQALASFSRPAPFYIFSLRFIPRKIKSTKQRPQT